MSQELLSYNVEDTGEFFGAEFACTVHFYAHAVGYKWAIEVRHVDLYECVPMDTLGTDGLVRRRFVKERRDVPAWLVALVAKHCHTDMVAVAESAADDARHADTAASRADDYRDELINRKMRG